MPDGVYAITITGVNAPETVAVLNHRLKDIMKRVEGPIVVEAAENPTEIRADHLVFTVNPHDTPMFAAEKILDELADLEWIAFEEGDLTEEEEAQIRDRLKGLGYIE